MTSDDIDGADTSSQADQSAAEPAAFNPLWRRIEAQLHDSIMAGDYAPGAQLPSDRQLAEMLNANRLTVRRALASLTQQGVLRVEHGVGTFVEQRIPYKFSERIRFNENLRASDTVPSRKVLRTRLIEADKRIANRLMLPLLSPVLRMDTIGYANDIPISVAQKYFSQQKFPGIADVFRREQSFTATYRLFGIEDYRRKSTRIISRLPTAQEAKALQQPGHAPVLAVEAVDVDMAGAAIAFQEGCYSGDRIVLVVGEEND